MDIFEWHQYIQNKMNEHYVGMFEEWAEYIASLNNITK